MRLQRRAVSMGWVWVVVFWAGGVREPLSSGGSVQPSFSSAGSYGESPELALRVARGQLPPVDRRLPGNPLLIQPTEQIGHYGGVLRSAFLGPTDVTWLERLLAYEPLVRWDPEWTQIIPSVAEYYHVNESATEFTFRLRRGMRWSDGASFSADDILFWYDAIYRDTHLGLGGASWLRIQNQPVVVRKLDDTTVQFQFVAPNSLFLPVLAGQAGTDPVSYPKHYLARFHARYNPEGIDRLVKEAGAADWIALFYQKMGHAQEGFTASRLNNPELPSLLPWILGQGISVEGPLEARRNPYYWKVDTAGNQLPYLDRLYFHRAKDGVELLDLARRGEFDFYERMALTTAANRSRLEAEQPTGGYRFFQVLRESANHAVIMLNLTHTNAQRRQVYQDKNFRIGLSLAMDRRCIIRELFLGQGQPYQAAPRPESPFYLERLARQYTDFDPVLASQYLERAGLTAPGADGWRRFPNGERATITVETAEQRLPVVLALEEVRKDWRNVGIELVARLQSRSSFYARKRANLHDAAAWSGDGGMDILMECRYYFPASEESSYAIPWAIWFANPSDSSAQPPPAPARRQMELYTRIRSTVAVQEQAQLMRQILEIAADEFYVIGVALPNLGYGLVNRHLRNVPLTIPDAGLNFPCPGPANPCQFFFPNPKGPP